MAIDDAMPRRVARWISAAEPDWDACLIEPPIVRNATSGPLLFASASVPNGLMVWWAVGFLALTLAWAVRSFERRAL